MSKYKVGQLLVTGGDVGIHVEEYNGKRIDAVVEYPKGEVFEIMEVVEKDGEDTEYRINFGIDVWDIDYTFEEWQIDSFLERE